MSQPPPDSDTSKCKKPRLGDSTEEKQLGGSPAEKKGNGFEELSFLGKPGSGVLARQVSRESDGKSGESIGASEEENQELGFDLNFPASSEGDAVAEGEGKSRELDFGYGGNGDLGIFLGSGKGETFSEGVASVSERRSSGREDKGKEKVDDGGDWLQLSTGSKAPPRPTSGHNSDNKRCKHHGARLGVKNVFVPVTDIEVEPILKES